MIRSFLLLLMAETLKVSPLLILSIREQLIPRKRNRTISGGNPKFNFKPQSLRGGGSALIFVRTQF